MATPSKKKPESAKSSNAVRRCGKAYKKRPKPQNKHERPQTEERLYKDMQIIRNREERRAISIARHRAKLEELAAAQAALAAELAAEAEAERKKRNFLGTLRRPEVTVSEVLELADDLMPLFSNG